MYVTFSLLRLSQQTRFGEISAILGPVNFDLYVKVTYISVGSTERRYLILYLRNTTVFITTQPRRIGAFSLARYDDTVKNHLQGDDNLLGRGNTHWSIFGPLLEGG